MSFQNLNKMKNFKNKKKKCIYAIKCKINDPLNGKRQILHKSAVAAINKMRTENYQEILHKIKMF